MSYNECIDVKSVDSKNKNVKRHVSYEKKIENIQKCLIKRVVDKLTKLFKSNEKILQ